MSSREQYKATLRKEKDLIKSQSKLIEEQLKELVLRQRHIDDLQMQIRILRDKLNKKWWQFWKLQ